jgi:type I restriction enzyme M protein
LNPPSARFSCVVGNPPFGDSVERGDDDKLGANTLASFTLAHDRSKVDSEQLIIERAVELLEDGGRFGLVVPDGLLNNQGEGSNCPRSRRYLARRGRIEAIVSLPDYAFRKSGAQNKTSIVFFRKFTHEQKAAFDAAYREVMTPNVDESTGIALAISRAHLDYHVFLAEANRIGYTTTGQPSDTNELYRAEGSGALADDQGGTIFGEWRLFSAEPAAYAGRTQPDCMGVEFVDLWLAHHSNRLDPKYHLFKREAARHTPEGWTRSPLGAVLARRVRPAQPDNEPGRYFTVLTLAQTGEIRAREAGKGRNPPEWSGAYLADMPSAWFAVEESDVVYSSIDLWKGCIAVVPADFAGGIVTKEFPVYEVTEPTLLPLFLQVLLRSRPYQRAFRAITTGHSNRRRTQQDDFEALEIVYPTDHEAQLRLVSGLQDARQDLSAATLTIQREMLAFSDVMDGRGEELLPDIAEEPAADEDDA